MKQLQIDILKEVSKGTSILSNHKQNILTIKRILKTEANTNFTEKEVIEFGIRLIAEQLKIKESR